MAMTNISYYRELARSINIDDAVVKYLKRSIAHTKDDLLVIAPISTLNDYLKEHYNMSMY